MEEEMEELHVEGVAAHDDPESCVDDPQGRGEALTGACAGRAIEPRNQGVRGADVVTRTEGTIAGGASASRQGTPRGQRTRACTEPPCARTGRSHDCPPTRRGAGRSGKAMPYARDERLWEVGQPHSTCEAAEQGRESGCGGGGGKGAGRGEHGQQDAPLSLIHISEPTRLRRISYAVFCLKKKKKNNKIKFKSKTKTKKKKKSKMMKDKYN